MASKCIAMRFATGTSSMVATPATRNKAMHSNQFTCLLLADLLINEFYFHSTTIPYYATVLSKYVWH